MSVVQSVQDVSSLLLENRWDEAVPRVAVGAARYEFVSTDACPPAAGEGETGD